MRTPARRFARALPRGALDADPRFYTTSDAIADLDAVRAAIGAAQVNLVGVSYGTRVALEYLRRHPAATRSVVLDGVVPAELVLGAEHARNLEAALDRAVRALRRRHGLRERFGSPARTPRRPAGPAACSSRSRCPSAIRSTDERARGTLDRARPSPGVVRLYAYVPQLAAMLPLLARRGGAGPPEVLMAQAAMIESLVGEQITLGMQLSVDLCRGRRPCCSVGSRPTRTPLLGTAFVARCSRSARSGRAGRRPADFHAPVRSDRPVLLLSGEFDPVTPPRYGEAGRDAPAERRAIWCCAGQGHNVMRHRLRAAADGGGSSQRPMRRASTRSAWTS